MLQVNEIVLFPPRSASFGNVAVERSVYSALNNKDQFSKINKLKQNTNIHTIYTSKKIKCAEWYNITAAFTKSESVLH